MLRRVFVSGLLAAAAEPQAPGVSGIAIRDVTVVDVDRGSLVQHQTVVVTGNRIADVRDSGKVRVPNQARIVDGRGKFLIPGLWDMHVHELPHPHVAELFVACGVTGVRNMYDDPAKLAELWALIRENRRTGPRMVKSGRVLNGHAENDQQIAVRSPDDARAVVRRQIREGADFIKIYNGLSREVFLAIADECRQSRIPFAGHTPDSVTTVEAAAAGQHSIEHLDGVLLDASGAGDWFRRTRVFLPDRRMLDTFDTGRASRLFAAYVRHGTWHCPTLSVCQSDVFVVDPRSVSNRSDPNLVRHLEKFWLPQRRVEGVRDPALRRAILQKMKDVTVRMHRAGVRLLAGSDTGAPYVLPGFGLHDELELLASAGLAPSDVLRMATLAPAEFLGRRHELGTITKGNLADLVLLDGDPLAAIENTRRIHAVVADGRLYDRGALDGILQRAGSSV